MKILVIQQKMIGDVLTSSILFEALRQRYPNAQLDYVINSHTEAVVENNPNIDNFKRVTPEIKNSKRAFYKFLKSIRKEHYDIVIDVYSKLSSNLITLFSGAKTKISYHKHYTTLFYHHNVKRKKAVDNSGGLAITNRLQLLEPLGIKADSIKPKIYLSPTEKEAAKTLLIQNGITLDQPLFMMSVLGSGKNKTYPFKYMAQVIDRVAKEINGTLLFNYIPNQKADALAIYKLCKPETQKQINFDFFGKSLRQFLTILSHCDAIIGNEGGAINMAKALDVKSFAIYSPWIDKATWSVFEDGVRNTSVHLKEHKPELYADKTEKSMKKQAHSLYVEFAPNYFKSKLVTFIKHCMSS